MSDVPVELATTDDAFLGGALKILQPRAGYRAGLDAVLLAAAAPVPDVGCCRVLDAGAGVGVVGLAIAARIATAQVTLVEIDPDLASLARRNAVRNGFEERAVVVEADIGRGGAVLHDPGRPAGLAPGVFDQLVANPPFYEVGSGTSPAVPSRRVSHQMPGGGLERWIAFLATAAAAGGTLTVIHRADALGQLLAALSGRFGGVRILPVHARTGETAGRVVVWAVKGSKAPLTLLPGLILQDVDGSYLPDIESIFRHGAALKI